jgi:hypothetical protein
MTKEELFFLAKVAPLGLDWLTTRETYRQRFGVRRYADWADVIELPPSSALSETPLQFRMYADQRAMDLPPEYLFDHFVPYDDARKNFRIIEGQLRETLGPPVVDDTSNALGRQWSFGVFGVSLTVWPPEMQRSERGRNTLLEKNPRLATAASLSIRSAYAFARPDASMQSLVALIHDARARGVGDRVLFLNPIAVRSLRPPLPRRETRRNPGALASVLSPDDLVAWRDESGATLGLSRTRESLVLRGTPKRCLILVRLAPARGPGGSVLLFQSDEPRNPARPYDERTTLLEGGAPDALDPTAARLSALWGLELREEEGFDD